MTKAAEVPAINEAIRLGQEFGRAGQVAGVQVLQPQHAVYCQVGADDQGHGRTAVEGRWSRAARVTGGRRHGRTVVTPERVTGNAGNTEAGAGLGSPAKPA